MQILNPDTNTTKSRYHQRAAKKILAWINRKRKYKWTNSRGYRPTVSTLKLLIGRLNEGYSPKDCCKAYMYVLNNMPEYADYITPFRPSNFQRYLERYEITSKPKHKLQTTFSVVSMEKALEDRKNEYKRY